MNKKLMIVAIFFVATLSIGELYRTSVDADYGFYTVRNIDNPSANFTYVDKTLHISVGDTIEWINNANPDEKLTIDGFEIVDENTFGGIFYYILKRNYQKYSYTFNKIGKYRVHIDEYPRLISQTIIVSYTTDNNPENLVSNAEFTGTISEVKITNKSQVVQSFNLQYVNETPITPEIVKITEVPAPIPQAQTNTAPKDIPGFEFIFAILSLLIFVRKYD